MYHGNVTEESFALLLEIRLVAGRTRGCATMAGSHGCESVCAVYIYFVRPRMFVLRASREWLGLLRTLDSMPRSHQVASSSRRGATQIRHTKCCPTNAQQLLGTCLLIPPSWEQGIFFLIFTAFRVVEFIYALGLFAILLLYTAKD